MNEESTVSKDTQNDIINILLLAKENKDCNYSFSDLVSIFQHSHPWLKEPRLKKAWSRRYHNKSSDNSTSDPNSVKA